jgi:hypothetical protein
MKSLIVFVLGFVLGAWGYSLAMQQAEIESKQPVKFTFEQVAVTAHKLDLPDGPRYTIMVGYVVNNVLKKHYAHAMVTCSLFRDDKLVGTTMNLVSEIPAEPQFNGNAGPTVEKLQPDSAKCTVAVI